MCGRFANDAEPNELLEEFVAQGVDYRDWRPRYSIAPTDTVPIVREHSATASETPQRRIEPARWDFRPPFVTGPRRPQFNARLETVADKGLWRTAFSRERCLVPMRGYFEWQGEPGSKRAFYLHGRGMLAAAAICTAVRTDDGWQRSTAIITRAARDAAGEIHDRMPVFLPRESWNEFLSPWVLDASGRQQLVDTIAEASNRIAPEIRAVEVSPRINSTRSADPFDATLVAPLNGIDGD